mgnify:FL=1
MVLNLMVSSLRADNKTTFDILGGAGGGVVVITTILSAVYYIIKSNVPTSTNIPYSLSDGQVMPYVSPDDPNFSMAANNYANNWVIENQKLNNAPVPDGTAASDLQNLYPDDWAIGFENFVAHTISQALGLKPADISQFVDKWQSGTGKSYVETINEINDVLSTGGVNSIGKWSVPDGYLNNLDYLIKNNLTSPDAIKSLNDYMMQSKSGWLPAKYTPGDVPPSNIPNIPNEPINTAGTISTGTGDGFSANYVNAYNSLLNDYNATAKTLSLADYNGTLIVSYNAIKQEITTAQQDINEAKQAGETDVSELEQQLEAATAKLAATEDAYKAANGGAEIPEE